MENLKWYKCNCGWQVETDIHELKCPICGSIDITVEIDSEEEEKEDNKILKMIEEDEIEYMKKEIRIQGNENLWYDVETIENPFARIEARKLFIRAGGVVPRNFEIRT